MRGGIEEAKLKKQEKAETSQFMEDLHLVFNGFFHFISLDFFKLANTLDPGGKHMGKNKKTKTKPCGSLWLVQQLLLGPGVWVAEWTVVCFSLLSIWSCGLLCSSISGHLGLLVTVLFYAAILYRMKAAAATAQERTILKMRGYVERVPRDPFQNRVSVFICACLPYRLREPGVGGDTVWTGTTTFLSDAKIQEVSKIWLISQD